MSGQLLTITDEENKRMTSSYTVWLKGKEYEVRTMFYTITVSNYRY